MLKFFLSSRFSSTSCHFLKFNILRSHLPIQTHIRKVVQNEHLVQQNRKETLSLFKHCSNVQHCSCSTLYVCLRTLNSLNSSKIFNLECWLILHSPSSLSFAYNNNYIHQQTVCLLVNPTLDMHANFLSHVTCFLNKAQCSR